MLAFLVVAAVVVALAFATLLAARALVGPRWLERLALGIQHFDGLRPRWHDSESLSRCHAGEAALLGSAATAMGDFARRGSVWHGTVRIGGELWSARSAAPVASGEILRVERVEGLTVVLGPSGPAA